MRKKNYVMTLISFSNDIHHNQKGICSIVLAYKYLPDMPFTKSFGYALRSILYIAIMSKEKSKVQVEEIAVRLSVPKHFLGKIMRLVVKNGILNSTKGPYG